MVRFVRHAALGTWLQRALGQDVFMASREGVWPVRCDNPDCEELEDSGFVFPAASRGLPASCDWPRDQDACPQHTGADCPRNYSNTMADYEASLPSTLVVEEELRQFLEDKIEEYLQIIDQCVSPSQTTADDPDGASVFAGSAGKALMHLRLHKKGFVPAPGKSYSSHLARAREYIDVALKFQNDISTSPLTKQQHLGVGARHIVPSSYCGHLWGTSGVNVMAAIIYDLQKESGRAMDFARVVSDIFRRAIDDTYCDFDDWDAGRAGLLYSAALLDYHFNRTMVDRELVKAVANAAVRRGSALGRTAGVDYMVFSTPNNNETWDDTSHGSAGVLYGILSFAPEVLDDAEVKAVVVRTVNHVVSNQQPSGNFPTEYFDPSEDVLVQWDHGAPGVGAMLLTATVALPAEAIANGWHDSAIKALEVVWSRGLLTKGLMLCHGIGGNIYMQLFAAKMTGDARYLHRALQFVRFVARTPELHDVSLMRIPTASPFTFWTGSWTSWVLLASDLYASDPLDAAMPTWELTY